MPELIRRLMLAIAGPRTGTAKAWGGQGALLPPARLPQRDHLASANQPGEGATLPARGAVELDHELAIGGAGGEFLVAFFQLDPQVDGLLIEVDDLLGQCIDVGGAPSPDFRQAWAHHLDPEAGAAMPNLPSLRADAGAIAEDSTGLAYSFVAVR